MELIERVDIEMIRTEAERFAVWLDAHQHDYNDARDALLRFGAYRAARRRYCFTNSFAQLRAVAQPIPEFSRITAGWPRRAVNLCVGLTSEYLWDYADPAERDRWLDMIG
jgi:hypothetical protein